MKSWLIKVLIPFWIGTYIFLFRVMSGVIFVSSVVILGVWQASLFFVIVFGIWGTIFYLILLQTDSIEKIREKISSLLEKKQGKMSTWLRNRFFTAGESVKLSPILTIMIFVIESPLSGAFIVRMAYPKEKIWQGLMWVWIGAAAEVATWFLPVYGGGFALLKTFWIWLTV